MSALRRLLEPVDRLSPSTAQAGTAQPEGIHDQAVSEAPGARREPGPVADRLRQARAGGSSPLPPPPAPRPRPLARPLPLRPRPRACSTSSELDRPSRPARTSTASSTRKWVAANPIPSDHTSWGAFNKLADDSLNTQHEIVDAAAKDAASAKAGSIEQKIGYLYASGMDDAAIDKAGFDPIKPQARRDRRPEEQRRRRRLYRPQLRPRRQPVFQFGSGADFKTPRCRSATPPGLAWACRPRSTTSTPKTRTSATPTSPISPRRWS